MARDLHRSPGWLHTERHLSTRAGWLRATVLGCDDGIVSTASLILGVGGANGTRTATLTAGLAGLAAGALSMAVGEYVSVSSQLDVERADLERERTELRRDPEAEQAELASLYEARGLSAPLARQVAEELSGGDRLAAHARDELGLTEETMARPVQAAVSSALSFAVGALVPILVFVIAPHGAWAVAVTAVSLGALGGLGAVSAHLGGASRSRASSRVLIGGAAAMVATYAIGALVHATGL